MPLPLLRRMFLLVLVLTVPSVGQAALGLCNDTTASQNVAVGYKQADNWISKGWWHLSAGECAEVHSGTSSSRFYYLRVETEGWLFTDDRLGFCVGDADFEIYGEDSCARRGFRQENFARIDTGRDAPGQTHDLSAHLTSIKSDPTVRKSSQPEFVTEAVFQGCDTESTAHASFCTFIGPGRRFLVYDDERTSLQLWTQIQQAIPGRRYQLLGQREDLFDTTSELVLHAAVVQPENSFDRLLASLQGLWQSKIDPNDSFRVSGAERINTYAGAETSVEYISLQKRCAEFEGEGMYLFTWDNNAGTSLCYEVARISAGELALIYLPRGNELVYRREG